MRVSNSVRSECQIPTLVVVGSNPTWRATNKSDNMKKPKHLGILSDRDKFFFSLMKGNILTYSSVWTYGEIQYMAKTRGITIEKFSESSPEYQKHGSRCAKVLKNKLHDKQMFHFDVEQLNI